MKLDLEFQEFMSQRRPGGHCVLGQYHKTVMEIKDLWGLEGGICNDYKGSID